MSHTYAITFGQKRERKVPGRGWEGSEEVSFKSNMSMIKEEGELYREDKAIFTIIDRWDTLRRYVADDRFQREVCDEIDRRRRRITGIFMRIFPRETMNLFCDYYRTGGMKVEVTCIQCSFKWDGWEYERETECVCKITAPGYPFYLIRGGEADQTKPVYLDRKAVSPDQIYHIPRLDVNLVSRVFFWVKFGELVECHYRLLIDRLGVVEDLEYLILQFLTIEEEPFKEWMKR